MKLLVPLAIAGCGPYSERVAAPVAKGTYDLMVQSQFPEQRGKITIE